MREREREKKAKTEKYTNKKKREREREARAGRNHCYYCDPEDPVHPIQTLALGLIRGFSEGEGVSA